MSRTIQELIEKSEEAVLTDYEYRAGVLVVKLCMRELDHQVVTIHVKTDILRAMVPDNPDIPSRTCHLEMTELDTLLIQDERGIYVPHRDFGTLMKQVKGGFFLAYGRRATACRWIFRVVGMWPFIVCLVESLDQIAWSIAEVR